MNMPIDDLHASRPGWLEAEMQAASRLLTISALRKLEAMGIPRGFLANATGEGLLGLMKVSIGKSGLFEPSGSEGRLIVAVHDEGELVDLAACSSTKRDDWALRCGAGWVLGFDSFADCRVGLEQRLRVHGNPFDWMCSGGNGICVLDWTPHALGQLRGLGHRVTLECDAGAERALVDVLAYRGLPRVVAAASERRFAA